VLFMLTSISLGSMQGNRVGAGEAVIERTGEVGEAVGAPASVPSVGNQPIDLPPPGQSQQLEVTPEVTTVPAGGEGEAAQQPAPEPQQ